MTLTDQQRRIDDIAWYHEIDFGNGLKSRSRETYIQGCRRAWRFIEQCLDGIDFSGKSVLDVGCWDGYWSFYAERRGARSVLAADDITQNWGTGEGIRLAKELLTSSVEINQQVSAYDLASLGRRFDIVLFMGVYYHLLSPLCAIAQLRHCCHPDATVVVEGDVTHSLAKNLAYINLPDPHHSIFIPTVDVLQQMFETAYFTVTSLSFVSGRRNARAPSRAAQFVHTLLGRNQTWRLVNRGWDRMVMTCKPFSGSNPHHVYRPPFGLAQYDPRFSEGG
jgi:tRNA (mo5U34)-methyltransferase